MGFSIKRLRFITQCIQRYDNLPDGAFFHALEQEGISQVEYMDYIDFIENETD